MEIPTHGGRREGAGRKRCWVPQAPRKTFHTAHDNKIKELQIQLDQTKDKLMEVSIELEVLQQCQHN